MNIDFANLKIGYQKNKKAFEKNMQKVLSSASYIMGEEIYELENILSDYTGAKYVISCSSGTDALLLAMMGLNIKPGDEVITTPFTFISTAETIAFLGAKPVFVDIEPKSYNINPKKIESRISSKTRAIIPVSLFGQVSDMDTINKIANKYNLAVIEDAAQSFGATYKNRKSCNLSTVGCTSFFPSKPLGCFGDGGAVFTNNKKLADKIKRLREHGQTKRYMYKHIGIGARLDNLQASILLVKMKHYENDINLRQNVAEQYNELLKNILPTPSVEKYNASVWAQYSIRVRSRESIQKELKKKGIPTAVYYPVPLHLQECFNYLGYKKGDFPVSEVVSKEIMSLPMNPYLTSLEQNYIVKELQRLL